MTIKDKVTEIIENNEDFDYYHTSEGEVGVKSFDKEQAIEELVEYIKKAILEDRKNILKYIKLKDNPYSYTGNTGSEYPADQIVDENSIINAPINI